LANYRWIKGGTNAFDLRNISEITPIAQINLGDFTSEQLKFMLKKNYKIGWRCSSN
jgi:hypothetical protein